MGRRTWLLCAALLIVASCGSEVADTTTVASLTSSVAPSTTTTEAVTTTGPIASTTTTSLVTTTTSQPIDVYFEGGQVVGPDRISFALGDEVSVWLLSDQDEEVHVHAYDLFFSAKAGIPLEISLTAEVPGIFEVELEGTHTLLFELVVDS